MKFQVSDDMVVKMDRALRSGGYLYDMDDIAAAIFNGSMQGHVEGQTWGITQVHEWPKKKSVNILFIVGDLREAMVLEKRIEEWARSIRASVITAIGRDGWWEHRTPGWQKIGTMYSKDIT